MLDWIHSIGAGALQGFTEFLPVSSSGHLFLYRNLFGADIDTALVVLLHVGTLLAVLFFLRKEIFTIFRGLWSREVRSLRLTAALFVGTLPALFVGLAIKGFLDSYLSMNWVIALNLWITGTLLLLSDRLQRERISLFEVGIRSGVLIGLFQAVAIMPGISRSGVTLFGALLLGLKRDAALQFSFLLSIPAILGGFVLKAGSIPLTGPNMAGFLVSIGTGWVALWCLYQLAKIRKLFFFSFYCWTVGFIVLFL